MLSTNGRAELSVDRIKKSFDNKEVIRDVSMNIKTSEVVGILGPNGAGKTTTFYLIAGLIKPDAGKILLDNEDVTKYPLYKRARLGISYLPQEASIFRKLTVRENILAILEMQPISDDEKEKRLKETFLEFDLEPLSDKQGYVLSGGERRRVEIARALVTHPRFLLMDEPFAGVDPIKVSGIQTEIKRLRDKGLGIIITDHNVRETLPITDRSYILADGEIKREGPPQKLAEDDLVKKIYLGDNFKLE